MFIGTPKLFPSVVLSCMHIYQNIPEISRMQLWCLIIDKLNTPTSIIFQNAGNAKIIS